MQGLDYERASARQQLGNSEDHTLHRLFADESKVRDDDVDSDVELTSRDLFVGHDAEIAAAPSPQPMSSTVLGLRLFTASMIARLVTVVRLSISFPLTARAHWAAFLCQASTILASLSGSVLMEIREKSGGNAGCRLLVLY